MGTFKFYQDVKVTLCRRNVVAVEAETKEEAKEILKAHKDEDLGFDTFDDDLITLQGSELVYDTEEEFCNDESGEAPTKWLVDPEEWDTFATGR